MNPEKKPHSEEKDYRNIEVIEQVFIDGTDEEMEKVRLLFNLTPEQLEMGRYYTRMRKDVHEKMEAEVEERKRKNPKFTPEESSIGVYIEQIEPQVRQAVLDLREKGYATYSSGFDDVSVQSVYFEEEHLKDFKFSEKFLQKMAKEGAVLKCDPNSVWFELTKPLSLDQVQKIWREVVEELPDLGHSATPAKNRSHKLLTKK